MTAQAALRQFIEGESTRLGFISLGVTIPKPPPHYDVYEKWLAQGLHAEMGYLATERARQVRSDPSRIIEDCASILMLAMPYFPAQVTGEQNPVDVPRGRVASYAWGDDYHDVLLERMEMLVERIESFLGRSISSRWYTDTGPILERDLAQRAGLGWIGKNTCLIHPQKGSYTLLAEIFLNLEMEPDQPFTIDHCGSCRRCLDACPTGCIRPDRTIDSRRCISYLTIELKGAIPKRLRPLIGEWVFGCDICQQVCPWNRRFAVEQGDKVFVPRVGLPEPNLVQELSLTPEAFNKKFKRSPVKRAKRRGYQRNVAVALGNHGNETAVPALGRTLQDEREPLVRCHAAWALGRINGAQARRVLSNAVEIEEHADVSAEIRAALQAIG